MSDLIPLVLIILVIGCVVFYLSNPTSSLIPQFIQNIIHPSSSSSSPVPTSSVPNPSLSSVPDVITGASNTPTCSLSQLSGSSSTYYLVNGMDSVISSGAQFTYNPTNPGVISLVNSGSAGGGQQITISNPCGDMNNITGTITLNGIDYTINIKPGSYLYINQYTFNTNKNASNTPPPPSNSSQVSINGYTQQGASGDVKGFDITGGSTPIQSCADACSAIDSCMGFSVDSGNTICNLKAAGYNGTTNTNQTQAVTYYSKNAITNRYFVLCTNNSWLSIDDCRDPNHNSDNWYFMRGDLDVVLRDTTKSTKTLPGQSVWYYNSKARQFRSALSPNWILACRSDGTLSIQDISTANAYSTQMYYTTHKLYGTNVIRLHDDSNTMMILGGKLKMATPYGDVPQWELIYLPEPKISASLPDNFDWNVVFLLRTTDKIQTTQGNQYGYLCAPDNAVKDQLHNSASTPLSCIFDSNDPYNNAGAFWSCYGKTCGSDSFATIYLRLKTTVCLQTDSGSGNDNVAINVIGTDEDCNSRGACGYPGTGFKFTSDGYLSVYGKYVSLNSNYTGFLLTSNKGSATKIVCIQINPANLDLKNYTKNSPAIF